MSFPTADQAAIYILRIINPRSIIENFEYGGLIYRTGAGLYDYTIPRSGAAGRRSCSGEIDRSNVSLNGIQIPAGAIEVGCYHTHGDYSVRDQNFTTNCPTQRRARNVSELMTQDRSPFGTRMWAGDYFSDVDIATLAERARGVAGYRGYLGTPSGIFYYYDPPNGRNQQILYRDTRPIITR